MGRDMGEEQSFRARVYTAPVRQLAGVSLAGTPWRVLSARTVTGELYGAVNTHCIGTFVHHPAPCGLHLASYQMHEVICVF